MKRAPNPPPLGPGVPGVGKLGPLIEFLEAQARELADEWTWDGTTFEQDQHTREAALNLLSAALHLRSLRSAATRAPVLGKDLRSKSRIK
jgi:hypothetical protein